MKTGWNDSAGIEPQSVAANRVFSAVLIVAIAGSVLPPDLLAEVGTKRISPRVLTAAHPNLAEGPWRYRAVQGKPFWFTLGGADDSPIHIATLARQPIADSGLAMWGVAEWEYSFHHLKNGQADGAGYKHYGGYPQPPRTRAEASDVVKTYFNRLANDARTNAKPDALKLFSSINGHYCYQHYACEWGCDIVGSEVGENVNGIQAHIAFTRGAARQYGRPWLIDFSSWYGPSMYDEDPKKHWGEYSGPDRGHSLSLHLRTYYVAYMAGANVVIAEGGHLNFFRSQQPGTDGKLPLSKLGEEGARFYAFTKRYPERGIPYTPFGLIIDTEHGIYPGFGAKLTWNAFPYTRSDQRILDIWNAFFPDSIEVQSKRNERGYLVESPYGDTLDVLLNNASDETLKSYPVLLVAGEISGGEAFAKRLAKYVNQGGTLLLCEDDAKNASLAHALKLNPHAMNKTKSSYVRERRGRGTVVIYSENGSNSSSLASALTKLYDELVPFRVSGLVESLYNRTADGWMVTLVNNEGITKAYNQPPIIDADTQSVDVRYTGSERVRSACLCTLNGDQPLEPANLRLAIPPGELRIIRLTLAPVGRQNRK
ncbi:MAG: hypothetical protein ABIP71_08995 [Verrucomicrobiota bacterium]